MLYIEKGEWSARKMNPLINTMYDFSILYCHLLECTESNQRSTQPCSGLSVLVSIATNTSITFLPLAPYPELTRYLFTAGLMRQPMEQAYASQGAGLHMQIICEQFRVNYSRVNAPRHMATHAGA